MVRKRIPLKPVSFSHAWSAIVNGRRGEKKRLRNPYRKYTTLWYVWQTGHDNPTLDGLFLLGRLKELGYPIGEKQ